MHDMPRTDLVEAMQGAVELGRRVDAPMPARPKDERTVLPRHFEPAVALAHGATVYTPNRRRPMLNAAVAARELG